MYYQAAGFNLMTDARWNAYYMLLDVITDKPITYDAMWVNFV